MRRVLLVWGNWGPYHRARFLAFRRAGATAGLLVEGLELFSRSGIYDWEAPPAAEGLHRLDLGRNEMAFRPWLLLRTAAPLIRRLRPSVVFVPSYWHWSLFLNVVARLAGARVVMMNESHAGTERARGPARWLKRRIVSSFHAALVGGSPHRRFFAALGLPAGRIHLGYDAVDNDWFGRAADEARAGAAAVRARLQLPERYFLSLGRLVEKKNLGVLIRAFARLREETPPGERPALPSLVLVGSGEKEVELRRGCRELGLAVIDHPITPGAPGANGDAAGAVHFFGFRQIRDNALFYGLADAFVLPSVREEWGLVVNEAMACGLPVLVSRAAGCAEDLVEDGVNGYLFAPGEAGELAARLRLLAMDAPLRRRMGQAARERIRHWGCERFAQGALAAVETASSGSRGTGPA